MDDVEDIERAVELLREDRYREAYDKLLPVIDNCVKRALGKLGLHLNRDDRTNGSQPIAHDLHQEARLYWFERLREGRIDPSVDPPQITRLISLSTYSYIKRQYYDSENTRTVSTEDVERDRDISDFEELGLPDSMKTFGDYAVEDDIDRDRIDDNKATIQSWLTSVKRNLGVSDSLNYLSKLSDLMVQRHYHLTGGDILSIGGL